MPLTRVERRARRLFGAVLHLYPASYRDEYGREMTLVLLDRLRGERHAAARVVVLFAAVASVFADAPKQHAFVLAQDLRLALRLIRRELRARGATGTSPRTRACSPGGSAST